MITWTESARKVILNEAPQFDRRQHAERILMRVPVEVRGTAADGTTLEEKTHTGVVGILGAMVRTSRMLRMGTPVVIKNRFSQQTAQFRVVWVKDYQDGEYWEIGVESVQPLDDFWGVRFPPKLGH